VIPLILVTLFSCTQELSETGFFDEEDVLFSIAEYMEANQDEYGQFLEIVNSAGSFDALHTYNPGGLGFTLFLPSNRAVDRYISNSDDYPDFESLVNDESFCMRLVQYHLVNMAIHSTRFPYGALPDSTASGEYLTITIEVSEDTTIYMVNNLAAVTGRNIEVSNGYIHVIDNMLEPISFSSYDWLADNPSFSIISALFEVTGLKDTMGVFRRTGTGLMVKNPYTILAEPDSVYARWGIENLQALIEKIGTPGMEPDDTKNALYQFAAYHILEGIHFLDNMQSGNYNTYALAPVSINSEYDIQINLEVDTFQMIITETDTTYINYILPLYNHSNTNTKNGAIHAINQVMEFFIPRLSTVTFQFYEEPEIKSRKDVLGTYRFVDKDLFNFITWDGPDMITYVKSASSAGRLENGDYLLIEGTFSIDYLIPKLLPGTYDLVLQAHAKSQDNATVEVYLDGNKMGSNYNLTTAAQNEPAYQKFDLGLAEFTRYEQHTVRVESLTPGVFRWDFIRFVPNTSK